MSEMVTDTGATPAAEAVLLYELGELWQLQNNNRDIWQGLHDKPAESIISAAVADIGIDVRLGHDLDTNVAARLGQSVFSAYVERKAAEEQCEVNKQLVARHREAIKELWSELMEEIITVEAVEGASYPMYLAGAPWRRSIRRYSQSECPKIVTGKLVPLSTRESYCGDTDLILEPTKFTEWVRGAYYINPIGEDGAPQVSLTAESRLDI